MTSRTLNRELIVHRDLALGYGTTLQTRGTFPEVAEQLIELDFIFRSNNEIRYLDTTRYTRASVHTIGPVTHYVFDPSSTAIDDDNTVLAPIPAIAVGRWIRITSSSGASLNYATVAALIADIAIITTIAPDTQVSVSGYHEAGDFGGGAFYWDELSTDVHDGGMVLTPAGRTDPGRWKRIISTLLSVHHFGAVGDNIVNDRTAVEAALTASAAYKISVAFRDLSYNVAGLDLTITDNIRIIGTGWPLLYNGVQITFTAESVSIINLGLVDWSGGFELSPVGGPIGKATYNFEQFNAVRCAYGIRSLDINAVTATLRVRGGYFNGELLRHAYYFVGKVEVVDIENIKINTIGSTSDNLETVGIGLGVTTHDCDTVLIRNCEIDGLIANTDIRCSAIYVSGSRITVTDNIIKNINGAGEWKRAIHVIGNNTIVTNNSITNGGESLNGGWITCASWNDDNNFIVANNILDGETGKIGKCMYLAGVGTVSNNRMFGDAIERAMTLVGQPNWKQFNVTSNYINCPAALIGVYVVELNNSIIDDNHILVLGTAIGSAAPLVTYAIENTIFSNNFLQGEIAIEFTEAAGIRMDNNILHGTLADIVGDYKNTWWFVDGVMWATATELADVASVVNTMVYKKAGLMIWDDTSDRPVYAIHSVPSAVWNDAAGALAYTPV